MESTCTDKVVVMDFEAPVVLPKLTLAQAQQVRLSCISFLFSFWILRNAGSLEQLLLVSTVLCDLGIVVGFVGRSLIGARCNVLTIFVVPVLIAGATCGPSKVDSLAVNPSESW